MKNINGRALRDRISAAVIDSLEDTARLPEFDTPFEDELERTQTLPAVVLYSRRLEAVQIVERHEWAELSAKFNADIRASMENVMQRVYGDSGKGGYSAGFDK